METLRAGAGGERLRNQRQDANETISSAGGWMDGRMDGWMEPGDSSLLLSVCSSCSNRQKGTVHLCHPPIHATGPGLGVRTTGKPLVILGRR
jgi:hypothetical protein